MAPNEKDDIYECGILIESKSRSKGYAKDALRLLVREANKNGMELDKIYKYLNKIRDNIVEKSNVSMHIYASKHNDKYSNKTNNKSSKFR